MNTRFETSYGNDLKKIVDKALKAEIKQTTLSAEEAKTLKDIPKLRKLQGYKKGKYYRIRVGDYRIGVTVEGDLLTFERCLPRKDFYKYYP